HLTFTALVRALATIERPAVLFLDDLQWADLSSLRLLRALASDPEIRCLLILLAYRTEEVPSDHVVSREAQAMRDAGTKGGTIELGPLDEDALVALLCGYLRTDRAQTEPLARVIAQKTAGNPFFVRRYLGFLHRRRLLVFHVDRNAWTWDL